MSGDLIPGHLTIFWMSLLILYTISQLAHLTSGQKDGFDLYPRANITVDQIPDVDPNIPRQVVDMPRDCAEVLDQNKDAPSGVYTIFPDTCPECYYSVYCDMTHDGGGWTVIMRRFNGSIDFYRGWYFYECGFGNINGEFYLGNNRIHQLTTQKQMELKISLMDVGMVVSSAGYAHFYLGNATENHALHVDSYYGDAGDYLSKSNNRPFSTFDHDFDGSLKNCAAYFHSAWWYHSYGDCHSSTNLFGYYFLGRNELPNFAGPGLSYRPVPGPGGPAIKEVVMKIRPMGYIGGSYMDPGVLPLPVNGAK